MYAILLLTKASNATDSGAILTNPYIASATFDSENPPAFVALSDVLIEPYSSDYNPYSNPVDYETVAAQTPEARRFIYGLGSGGVLSRGAGTTRLETSVVEPNSTQPDLANPQTDDNIEADRDLQTQAPPAENPQSEPSNQQVDLAQPPTTDFTKTLLADETFEALVRTDYDPFWMRNTGLDPSVLAEWTSHQISRYKIGQFFSAVFKTGDIFRLPIILEGASVVKTAVVSAFKRSH